MYNIYTGKITAAATYLSIAYRFASILGAHREPVSGGPTTLGSEHAKTPTSPLRRLFWLCYMFDKDICLRAGYPPVIDDNHCDLALPPGYKQIDALDTFRDGSEGFPGDMRLTIIKSKAISLLFCLRSFGKSDAELLRDIRELDDELETWRASISPRHRPSLALGHRIKLEPGMTKAKRIHIIVIHLEYYFLLALFHSASGRCRVWGCDKGAQAANVTSSQALALQASRSTIVNLGEVAHVFNCGDFW